MAVEMELEHLRGKAAELALAIAHYRRVQGMLAYAAALVCKMENWDCRVPEPPRVRVFYNHVHAVLDGDELKAVWEKVREAEKAVKALVEKLEAELQKTVARQLVLERAGDLVRQYEHKLRRAYNEGQEAEEPAVEAEAG